MWPCRGFSPTDGLLVPSRRMETDNWGVSEALGPTSKADGSPHLMGEADEQLNNMTSPTAGEGAEGTHRGDSWFGPGGTVGRKGHLSRFAVRQPGPHGVPYLTLHPESDHPPNPRERAPQGRCFPEGVPNLGGPWQHLVALCRQAAGDDRPHQDQPHRVLEAPPPSWSQLARNGKPPDPVAVLLHTGSPTATAGPAVWGKLSPENWGHLFTHQTYRGKQADEKILTRV